MMLPLLKDLLAIAGCSFFIVALTGLFLRTTRRIATSIAVFLAAPLAVAFAIDACGSHATRLLIARGAPLTALAVSADEGLLALADQKGEIVVLRTDSGRILRAIKKGQVRALEIVMRDDSGATLNSPGLLAVDGAGAFQLYDAVSGSGGFLEALKSPPAQQQTQKASPDSTAVRPKSHLLSSGRSRSHLLVIGNIKGVIRSHQIIDYP